MPQYLGSYYTTGSPDLGGQGILTLNSEAGANADLSVLQDAVRRYRSYPNVVGWLEPHGEQFYGFQEFLLYYGPVADRSYRTFLKQSRSLAELSQRWYGDPKHLRVWEDVRVPEYASFLGWGPSAIDLSGEWL
jgi:hypothetical protein